jgi:hypothetical protein
MNKLNKGRKQMISKKHTQVLNHFLALSLSYTSYSLTSHSLTRVLGN